MQIDASRSREKSEDTMPFGVHSIVPFIYLTKYGRFNLAIRNGLLSRPASLTELSLRCDIVVFIAEQRNINGIVPSWILVRRRYIAFGVRGTHTPATFVSHVHAATS
jgi:hypothetical protein